jgi:hypothetical protein
MAKLILPCWSDLHVAGTTVDRPVFAGFEGYFRFLTTLSTNCGEHFTGEIVTAISVALSSPRLAAVGAAFGFVGISPGRE